MIAKRLTNLLNNIKVNMSSDKFMDEYRKYKKNDQDAAYNIYKKHIEEHLKILNKPSRKDQLKKSIINTEEQLMLLKKELHDLEFKDKFNGLIDE